MMNKHSRRLSKMPEEVRAEIEPYFMVKAPIVEEDKRKLPKLEDGTANHVRRGLTVSFRSTCSPLIIANFPFSC